VAWRNNMKYQRRDRRSISVGVERISAAINGEMLKTEI
jgi:hypothetical protein